MADRAALRRLLQAVESEMKTLELWADQPPAAVAFQSTTPFFADTMAFQEWLQWVFLPRFQQLLDQDHPLPDKAAIQPMAEEMFKALSLDTNSLLGLLGEFDSELSRL